MIQNDAKTSILIPSQLPGFIRDNTDYTNFVAFLQAYYEYLELANTSNTSITTTNEIKNQGVTYASKNLTEYFDIDSTIDGFLNYFVNDFLPNFPDDALTDKRTALKYARQLYQSKGTPASYQFLFRLLYNSDFDYYNTGDVTLKASSGIWYVTKSLRLATSDSRFLNIANYRLFGETSKSIATIEASTFSQNRTEVFISNIERLFQSGEFVRVVDNNNQDVIVNGTNLRAKIVGQISQINIAKDVLGNAIRGLFYSVGDPVVVYGGLNTTVANPIPASAQVGSVTTGTLQQINVVRGGYGYRTDPNTKIIFSGLNDGATQPIAAVTSVDPSAANTANVFLIPINSIGRAQTYTIGANSYVWATGHTSANANTTLANTFAYISFGTYPITAVTVKNSGGGISTNPSIYADSQYTTDYPAFSVGHLKNLGILAPIVIVSGGSNYRSNDTITISGGRGLGAVANLTVDPLHSNAISSIYYTTQNTSTNRVMFPPGGLGYTTDSIPTVTINTSTGSGANVYIPGILGDGATFSSSVDRAGSVTTINIIDYGQDYVSQPGVSLAVQDIIVTGLNPYNLPQKGQTVYQGSSYSGSSYAASVDSIRILQNAGNAINNLYSLRVYNYNATPDVGQQLKISNTAITMSIVNSNYATNYFYTGSPAFTAGLKTYGDGNAKAVATFLNGLAVGQGQYLNTQGQPSSFDILQSSRYNNFTYEITVQKEIAKYRTILQNLLHPSGMQLFGRYAVKSANNYSTSNNYSTMGAHTAYYYTGTAATTASITTDFTNYSNNIVTFSNLSGANIANFIFANSTITLSPTNGPNVVSGISSVDYANNRIILTTNTFLTFANVAYVSANANSTVINITSLTNAYDIMNNGKYSNTAYPLYDIVYAGDKVSLNTNIYTVQSVNPSLGQITVTSNVSSNIANSLLSVSRTYAAGGTIGKAQQIVIYGLVGQSYVPSLITESGLLITTENGTTLILIG